MEGQADPRTRRVDNESRKDSRQGYEQLALQFNPVKFDAEEIVRLAKNAGMKYIVITSKHHDGFAMYHSKASKFNIVDATPFKRDPLKELADAAQKGGIKLGFYYSQTQDWHEPDAVGNDWDFPDESKKNFAKYLEEKVKPQVTEILTNYGPIGLIWFDTPETLRRNKASNLSISSTRSSRTRLSAGASDTVSAITIQPATTRSAWAMHVESGKRRSR
jgi:alpha-L-fucosidase